MFLIPKDYWKVRQTKNKGRGVFAKKEILKRIIIGDYTGKLIELRDIDFDEERKNMYLMYYDDHHGIYPDLRKSGVHLINHSCSPNAWITPYKNHTLVFALKNIQKGEEITISYLLPPKTKCTSCPHSCHCGSPNCSGSMHQSEVSYKIWQSFINKIGNKRLSKTINKKVLEPLNTYPKTVSLAYISKIMKLKLQQN